MKYLKYLLILLPFAVLVLSLLLAPFLAAQESVHITIAVYGKTAQGEYLKPLYGTEVYIWGTYYVTGTGGIVRVAVPAEHGAGTLYLYHTGFQPKVITFEPGGEKDGGWYEFSLIRNE